MTSSTNDPNSFPGAFESSMPENVGHSLSQPSPLLNFGNNCFPSTTSSRSNSSFPMMLPPTLFPGYCSPLAGIFPSVMPPAIQLPLLSNGLPQMRPQASLLSSSTEEGQKMKGSELDSSKGKGSTGSESSGATATVEGACKEIPRWRPRQKQDKIKAKKPAFVRSAKPSVSMPPERRFRALNNPDVARTATPEFILKEHFPEISSFLLPFLGAEDTLITMKISPVPTEEEIDEMYSFFLGRTLQKMDAAIPAFLNQKFSSYDDAIFALTAFVRSYVSGFTVHRQSSKRQGDAYIIRLQCHTKNNHPRNKGTRDSIEASTEAESSGAGKQSFNCKWRAIVKSICEHRPDNSTSNCAFFKHIDSFSKHTRECFGSFARPTPTEVSFQAFLSKYNRPGVVKLLHQPLVDSKTLGKRINRENNAEEAKIEEAFSKLMEKQTIDFSIDRVTEEEVVEVLRYLTLLREKEQFEVFVSSSDATTNTQLDCISLMWKDGKDLLATHSDVIFCDSMWSVSVNGYFLLTIVVVDQNFKLRLVALSLTAIEQQTSWENFFSWVKNNVPAFKPQCVVTDGASYIYKAFVESMEYECLHIVCWWHQKINMKDKYGKPRKIRRYLLSMAYASSEDELNELKRKVTILAEGRTSILEAINHSYRTSFMKLDRFTGGTISNSYAESVNSLLRKAGMTVHYDMLTILRMLHGFVEERSGSIPKPFSPNNLMETILDLVVLKTVTNGALHYFSVRVTHSIQRCTIEGEKDDVYSVKELVVYINEDNGSESEKEVSWVVNWSSPVPICSCNGVVYRGLPCQHIALCAVERHAKIPLECFNPRFYVNSVNPGHASFPPLDDDDDDDDNDDNDDDDDDDDDDRGKILPQLVRSDEEREAQKELEESCKDESRSRRVHDSSSIVKLRTLDEIEFYRELERSANILVDLCKIPEYEEKVQIIGNFISRVLDEEEKAYEAIRGSALGTEDDGLEESGDKLLIVISDEEFKEMSDEIHIISASVDARNPSMGMCIFRGDLKASFVRLLRLRKRDPTTADSIASSFKIKVQFLAEERKKSPSYSVISLSKPNGRPTSKTFKDVPNAVSVQGVIALTEARNKRKSIVSKSSPQSITAVPSDFALAVSASDQHESVDTSALTACPKTSECEDRVEKPQSPSTRKKRKQASSSSTEAFERPKSKRRTTVV